MSSAMLSGVHSAREHLPQRADVRDRPPPPMTFNEPRGPYSDVTGQYRERESTSRDPYRGPANMMHINNSTQATPPGLMTPPWNNIPGESNYVFVLCF